MYEPESIHCPVLLDRLMDILDYAPTAVVVDTTIGRAGHARALAERLDENGLLVGLDVDPDSITAVRPCLETLRCRVELRRENFGRLETVLDEMNIPAVDVILADLGFSSDQLAQSGRGLSFQTDGPLDMRLDDRLETTAAKLLSSLPAGELADLFWQFGQERKSRRIARAIVTARRQQPLKTTAQLVTVINRALGITTLGRRSRIHPATKTFQALRIAVNDELSQLQRLLKAAVGLLKPGGYIAVISFHSLEDRIVKYDFRANQAEGCYEIITRKPIIADERERKTNPRSRSAKMRLARRLHG